jgi:hypothetical protein
VLVIDVECASNLQECRNYEGCDDDDQENVDVFHFLFLFLVGVFGGRKETCHYYGNGR